MTTKTAGGKITGLLALTMDCAVTLAEGDPVHVSGDYTVSPADGTKRLLGTVSVPAWKRTVTATSDTFAARAGQVTVEALGFYVTTITAGGAIAAGAEVGVNASGDFVTMGASMALFGIALTHSTGAAQKIDVLVIGGSPVGA
jgi:hypothetical protein